MEKPSLKIDWATYEAAKWACERWHYSKCIPKSKLVMFGVWEDRNFRGVVIFGVGATSDLVKRYGLKSTQGCELVRVALTRHATPVTRIISIAIKMLKKANPGLRLLVSFADPEKGHHGGIYQGGVGHIADALNRRMNTCFRGSVGKDDLFGTHTKAWRRILELPWSKEARSIGTSTLWTMK